MSDEGSFEIVIDYCRGESDPARVFKAMSGLIESFQSIDRHLMSTIGVSVQANLVLDDIERGSLKAKLKNLIKDIPDSALRNAEWKKIIGHFLIRSKERILLWCNNNKRISRLEDVKVLADELRQLAKTLEEIDFPVRGSIQTETLLSDINQIQESLKHLGDKDHAFYNYDTESVEFNKDLEIPDEIIREISTYLFVQESNKKILKVVKTDYDEQSMWEFKLDGRLIKAKIAIEEWLKQFKSRRLIVESGDFIKVDLYQELSYGREGEIINRYYEVEKVHEVINP